MNTVSKSQLKAKMLEYLRRVERTGEELIITDDRVPVLKVVPIKRGGLTSEIFKNLQKDLGPEKEILSGVEQEWDGEDL